MSNLIQPERLRLEAASYCNLRCPSCPTTTGAIHPAIGSGLLKLRDFQNLIDENPSVKVIELSNYGEVFLNPDLLAIMEYAYQHGVALSIDNGANLNKVTPEQLEGLVKYQVRSVLCSIDGASPETYKVYRIRGDFNRVIENIRQINRFKAHYQSEYPKLMWQFVVFGHNEHEIPVARQMAAELNMDFNPKLSWDDKFSPVRNRDLVRKEVGIGAASRQEYQENSGHAYMDWICNQLFTQPQINHDGRVLGCCRNFWGDFGGNAFTDGLTAAVNSEKMEYARQMVQGQQPPRADIPCTTCGIYLARQAKQEWLGPVLPALPSAGTPTSPAPNQQA